MSSNHSSFTLWLKREPGAREGWMDGRSSVHASEELQEGFPEEVIFELGSTRQVGVLQPSQVESSLQAEGTA